jgi:hypothetical protein
MFVERTCLDCPTVVIFGGPEDATCPRCGLKMYLTEEANRPLSE